MLNYLKSLFNELFGGPKAGEVAPVAAPYKVEIPVLDTEVPAAKKPAAKKPAAKKPAAKKPATN